MEDKDKESVHKFSCKFYGDFCLPKPPTTFQDAVEVYQSLPGLLGDKAVPVKVWLLPLTALDSSAAKLVRQISTGLVQEAQTVLEDFSEVEMRYNDVLGTSTAQQFPQIGKKLKSFKEMCSEFKLEFQQTLAKKLPSIRGGGEEEAELAEILKKRHSSPFSSKNLNEWMDCKEREVDTLMSFTKMMKNTKIISSQNDLYKESLSAEHVVCFVFTSLGKDEPYLSALSRYLKGTNQQRNQPNLLVSLFSFIFMFIFNVFHQKSHTPTNPDLQDPHTHDVEKEQWYASKEVTAEMWRKAKLFSDFAEANEENKNMTFLTVGLTNETQEGSSIHLYEGGFAVSENFEPPSKPETVTAADINHNSVTLKISPPRFGAENITSYSVEYCVSGEDGWQQKTEAKAEEVTVRDLKPNKEYVFRCRAVTSAGVGPANKVSIKTLPCSPPGKPQAQPYSSEISVSWEKPAELGEDVQILGYMVEYSKTDDNEEALQWNQTKSAGEKVILSGLQTETEYAVRVRCDCGSAGRSKESITVKVCTTFNHLAELLRIKSKKIKSDSPSVYKLPLTEEHMNIDGCRKFNFGEESTRQNRTIMLFGATGSGKSTLIDGMINYIVGVEWEDSFRFKFINEDQSTSRAPSQTSEVTVYKINHQDGFKIPFSLTIIDTPGFGDTRGIERDREITEQLCNLFTDQHGVTDIDAVCFVAQAALARLTATQKYVFDSVFSIFGKDVAENISIVVTFADGQRPPVLEAINAAGVPCPETKDGLPVHFKFNNSALFANNKSAEGDRMSDDDDEGDFDQMFWKMGTKSMKRFFAALNKREPKSLTLTKEVLRERKILEITVENLQVQVKLGLAKLEEINKTSDKLKEYEAEMSRNENFEFTVAVMKPYKARISGTGNFIINCQQCHVTCYYPSSTSRDSVKEVCEEAASHGFCTECPGKCHINVHFLQKYSWEYQIVREKQTVKELKEKYPKTNNYQTVVEGLRSNLWDEECDLENEVETLLQKSAECLDRLREISVKPNPLSTEEYIELFINGERSETKQGWEERVEALKEITAGV
uniref:Fibronectin type-III domain-containing protein n=3 Tax=Astatotilapia calliptera TaxID=8154 RepID=A0AAX7VQ90_ASTCA